MNGIFRPIALTAFIADLCLVLAACGANNYPPAPALSVSDLASITQSYQKADPSKIDVAHLISNMHLSESDKTALLRFYLKAPHHLGETSDAKHTIVAVAMIDVHGHIVKQWANRSDVAIIPYRSPGRSGVSPPCTGNCTGPFQQLKTQTQPIQPYNTATANLPCEPTMEANDTPYIYLGGKTSQSGSQVESGLQWNATNPTGTTPAWQPYIRLAYTTTKNSSGYWTYDIANGAGYGITSSAWGTGSTAHWLCGANSTITVSIEFANEIVEITESHALYYYECFLNDSWQGSNGAIVFGMCITPGKTTTGNSWKGWLTEHQAFNGNLCTTCTMLQTISIAQSGGNNYPNDGAYYGPVALSGITVGSSSSYAYSYCTNWPEWHDGDGSECGTTPSSPAPTNSVIQVSSQSLIETGIGAYETITLNNECHNWEDFSCP